MHKQMHKDNQENITYTHKHNSTAEFGDGNNNHQVLSVVHCRPLHCMKASKDNAHGSLGLALAQILPRVLRRESLDRTENCSPESGSFQEGFMFSGLITRKIAVWPCALKTQGESMPCLTVAFRWIPNDFVKVAPRTILHV